MLIWTLLKFKFRKKLEEKRQKKERKEGGREGVNKDRGEEERRGEVGAEDSDESPSNTAPLSPPRPAVTASSLITLMQRNAGCHGDV